MLFDYMKNFNFKKIKGYVEGYYGRLLKWNERIKILDTLASNKMNFYFYCPKEDIYHRKNWRLSYPKDWVKNFNLFCRTAREKKINVIVGISPSLDFDYKSYISGEKSELLILIKKLNFLMKNGASFCAILFDDVPDNFKEKFKIHNEGEIHAKLVNDVNSIIKENIFSVPRVYSDELLQKNSQYINEFYGKLNKVIYTFYCGKYIVSKKFESNLQIINIKANKNRLVYWDNFYANDYCPKRLIIGPWKNSNLIERSMINGTGQLHTDKLILEIVHKNSQKKDKILNWKKTLENNKVPSEFFKISENFLSPNLTSDRKVKNIKFDKKLYDYIDKLLWDWKSDLSREWYPYLLNFKHDLQILNKELSFNRILKTQNIPLQKKLTK